MALCPEMAGVAQAGVAHKPLLSASHPVAPFEDAAITWFLSTAVLNHYQTSTPGPVTASFEYSNCTGAVYYVSFNTPVNVCRNSTSTSVLTIDTNEYFEQRSNLRDGNCGADGGEHNYVGSRAYYFTCRPYGVEARRESDETETAFGSFNLNHLRVSAIQVRQSLLRSGLLSLRCTFHM